MRLPGRFKNIGFRLFILAFVFICVITAVYSVLAVRHDRRIYTEELMEKGYMLSKLFAHNSRLGVFSKNPDFLRNMLEGLLQEEDIISASVFELDGSILLMLDQPLQNKIQVGSGRQHFMETLYKLKESQEPYYTEWNNMFEFWAPVLTERAYRTRDELISGEAVSGRSEKVIGFVRLVYGKAVLDKKLRGLLLKNMIFAVFFLISGSVAAFFVAGRITRPLGKLTEAVSAFGKGERIEIMPGGEDETGRLAEAFNEMQETLVKREESLKELNARLLLEMDEKIRLQESTVRAAQLASLGELAAGVAHEINTPINSIINCAQLLMDEQGAPDRADNYAQVIMDEGGRIAGIAENLLSFARDNRTDKRPVSVHEMLSVSLGLLGSQLKKEGITVLNTVPPDLPEVIAHKQQIEQVFVNLISNARYALNLRYPGADENKVLKISAEEVLLENHAYVLIAFCDHGSGVPAGIRDKLMQPFFTTKPAGLGTGLGLSVSYGILQEHKGSLNIESLEGEYTKVLITLPAAAGRKEFDK